MSLKHSLFIFRKGESLDARFEGYEKEKVDFHVKRFKNLIRLQKDEFILKDKVLQMIEEEFE